MQNSEGREKGREGMKESCLAGWIHKAFGTWKLILFLVNIHWCKF